MGDLPERVDEILRRLESAGYEAWCVGGAVRDRLLGRTPGDWDVTTNAPPDKVLQLFAPHAAPTGLQHGTVTVFGGNGVEVTTYRRDGTYSDSRHPDRVEFTGSLEEDLSRRDFTVNAIALNRRLELRDPFHGREDLEKQVLRAVGEPERRFREDALRILRGLRFASKLGFAIEPDTGSALRRCAPLLEKIAVERIQVELSGLLCGDGAAAVLLAYPDVLGVFLPEILPGSSPALPWILPAVSPLAELLEFPSVLYLAFLLVSADLLSLPASASPSQPVLVLPSIQALVSHPVPALMSALVFLWASPWDGGMSPVSVSVSPSVSELASPLVSEFGPAPAFPSVSAPVSPDPLFHSAPAAPSPVALVSPWALPSSPVSVSSWDPAFW